MATKQIRTIGERVKDARLRKGLSQDKFAAALGTSRQNVIRWEKNKNHPSPRYVALIAGVTGRDPFEFTDEAVSVDCDDDDDDELCSIDRLLQRRIDLLITRRLQQSAAVNQG